MAVTEAEKAALKEEIVRERGYWSRFHEVLLERAPEFLEAYIRFQSAPTRSKVLPQKLCELVYIAIDFSVNHMYERGGRRHMDYALKAGATPEEVLQVVLLTTVVSAHHPVDLGLGILCDELGIGDEEAILDAEQEAAKRNYVATTGYWPATGNYMLATAPDFAQGYMAYGGAAWNAGPLSAKEKELIALAVCAAPTCLYEAGVRRHVGAALDAGATAAEISAVLQLSAALSVHTCTIGVPAFEDVTSGRLVE